MVMTYQQIRDKAEADAQKLGAKFLRRHVGWFEPLFAGELAGKARSVYQRAFHRALKQAREK